MSILDEDDNEDANARIIRARGRLKYARKWFAHHGWDVLPQGRRGQAILRWGADHAWLADPADPLRSVRRWCRRWAPWLKGAELDQLLEYVKTSNKRWSDDQSAAVLGITMRDRTTLGLRFIGANDDPNYEARLGIAKAKAAARARKSRAARSTGRKPGRPKAETPPAWQMAGFNSERTYYRHKARGETETGSKTPSRDISKNRGRDAISLPPGVSLPSLTPWEALGMKRSTYFRRKKAGTLPSPVEMPTIRSDALDLTGIDLAKFGITAIRVMSNNRVVRQWHAGCPWSAAPKATARAAPSLDSQNWG
jgi:hypothetical protein